MPSLRRSLIRPKPDEGTALVEFAMVMVIFFLLLFGIIIFGVTLSFQQTLTQAASEASRAAAVTLDDPATPADERFEAADRSIRDFNAWNRDCTHPGMVRCGSVTSPSGVVVHDCIDDTPPLTDDPAVLPDCVTVDVVYDYENHPIVPGVPLVESFTPPLLTASSTSQISDTGS